MAAIPLSIAALKFGPAPFVWICLLWSAVAFFSATLAGPTGVRVACVGAGSILGALGGAEAWLWVLHAPPEITRIVTPPYNVPDSILGWRLKPDLVARDLKRIGDSLIYDVTYTIDSAGRRIAPPDRGDQAEGCVWFFTDSFTFGLGVRDDATLPYRVGVRLDGRYRVVNFAVPAYGAEHMLATVERAATRARPPCRPTHVVYQALAHHVSRAGGRVEFARYGPRYALGPGGVPVYTGTPRHEGPLAWHRRVTARLDGQLRKSRLYTALADRERPGSPADLRLYLAIVRRTRDLLAAQDPHAQFHVLLWSQYEQFAGGFEPLRDSLVGITPQLHLVDDILPAYRAQPWRYQLHAQDAHPNALADELLAAYVADRILGARRRP